MCGLVEAGLAVMALSTGFSVYGQYQQGQAASAQAEYQAKQAEAAAQQTQYMMDDAAKRGREEEYRARMNTKAMEGKQRSLLAASGVTLDDGSALDVLGDTSMFGQMDVNDIRGNTDREIWQLANRQNSLQSEAAFSRSAASNARNNSWWNMGGSLLGGVGKMGGMAYQGDLLNSSKYGSSSWEQAYHIF